MAGMNEFWMNVSEILKGTDYLIEQSIVER